MKAKAGILMLSFVLATAFLTACNINGNRMDDLLYERTNNQNGEGPPIERTHNNRNNFYNENQDEADDLIRNEVNPLDRDGQEPDEGKDPSEERNNRE
ncbi:hypothetical protein [Halobacillus sp. Marseille-Q1614]|uniref:hypothetical protein n=1 Tax=Halobacillus sp. Marseille-Q1614 TaxID=2709134 RepID=UPI00156DBD71|nr:hypothetical protein [Halobacillus sp. Marseille-Q1614]